MKRLHCVAHPSSPLILSCCFRKRLLKFRPSVTRKILNYISVAVNGNEGLVEVKHNKAVRHNLMEAGLGRRAAADGGGGGEGSSGRQKSRFFCMILTVYKNETVVRKFENHLKNPRTEISKWALTKANMISTGCAIKVF